jgi:tRNA G18 (ribose-2'-O)-methylase SpoU
MTRRRFAREGRGFFAVGIYHPKAEVNTGSLWRSASLFGAAFVFTVGRRYKRQASDTPGTPSHTPLLHFADLDDLVEHLPHSCPLVGAELDPRASELSRFVHPERAAYLLGAEDHGLPQAVLGRCHRLVQIETARPESMNVACAGTVLLHHRLISAASMAAAPLDRSAP